MYLVIDLGNTNKKFALFHKGRLKSLTLLPSVSLKEVQQLISAHPGITHCILSSVIRFPAPVRNYLRKEFFFIELDEHTPVPVKNHYKTPSTLGKDRLASAVAGHRHFPSHPVLVVNAGSCITYDFISRRGEYIGGGISPGIRMRFLALHTFTGRLPLISDDKPFSLTGRNTEESILSGVINGALSEINGIISQYDRKYRDLKVILSGGDLKYFDKRLKIKTFAVPNIVIEGLNQILELNAGKNP